MNLDEPVPNYVVWCGGEWGVDLCVRPKEFTVRAQVAIRVLKRHFSLSKLRGDTHLVPYWARTLAEVLASSGAEVAETLLRAKQETVFRDGVCAALALGGHAGLRGYLISQGAVRER